MEGLRVPLVREAVVTDGAAMITFENGLCAIYTAFGSSCLCELAKIVSEQTCEEVKDAVKCDEVSSSSM